MRTSGIELRYNDDDFNTRILEFASGDDLEAVWHELRRLDGRMTDLVDDFTSKLYDLGKQLDGVENEIEHRRTDATSLREWVGTLRTEVRAETNRLAGARADIAELNNELSRTQCRIHDVEQRHEVQRLNFELHWHDHLQEGGTTQVAYPGDRD